ncbi:hypothetical protein B0A81_11470 [Flavobacterium plurextorum]|uniref:Uncharacterized protein n=1 Tax=Flavobacterium plurextorum TaxID=1114867 RepID=A0ABX4CTY4_9FLAO|nr:hypothetical protein [Flavobacterium plurextorum]OXB07363.1 hypothetical protein B0A81_11470 [Flavobacterium plurextorum]
MEKIQLGHSMSKKHWALDNDSIGILSTNYSKEDVESVNQQINAEPNNTQTEKKTVNIIKTEVNRLKKMNIEVPYTHVNNRFNIFKRKVYTKNNKTWKGVIVDINYPIFKAKLYDLDNHCGTYEIASFNIKTDITEQDHELIDLGAIFYWSIGNIIQNKTQTKRSEIRMRRLADITVKEFDELHDSLDTQYGNINWV